MPFEPRMVFRHDNPAMISLAEGILEEAGIEYLVQGDSLNQLFGGAALTEILVEESQAGRAAELLRELIESPEKFEVDPGAEEE